MFGLGQSDEAMLRDANHPAHRSGGREAIGVFLLVCILGAFLFSFVNVWFLPFIVKLAITLGYALFLANLMMRWIGGSAKRHALREQAEIRKTLEAEKQKQIDAMLRDASNVPKVKR
jgi:hypothetical protein